MEYPIESGQRMLVKPNGFEQYCDFGHLVVCFGKVVSTKKGIIVKDCSYVDKEGFTEYIDIPLFLLWRIADEEDLLEAHEVFIYSSVTKRC